MKNHSCLPYLILIVLMVFTACKEDEDPEPKPQSYFEYAGRVYELNSAVFLAQQPPNDSQLLVEFYSLEREELEAVSTTGSGQTLNGEILSLTLGSSLVGEVGEGTYTYTLNTTAGFYLYKASIVVGYEPEKEAGIFLYPEAGTVTIEEQEDGHLVTFEFTLSNQDVLTGRFQGELVKIN